MYWDVLVNKWFLGAFILCVICSIGCLLWYQNEMAKIQKETEAHEAFIVQLEDEKSDSEVTGIRTTPTGESGQDEWNENVETAFVNEDTVGISDFTSKKMKTSDAPSSKTKTRKVRVSPYGFGPYPEIPEDWPGKYPFNNTSADHELIARVQVKLWKQGIFTDGATMDEDGLVYPIIQGKVYVKWGEFIRTDGTVERYVARRLGHPDDFPKKTVTNENDIKTMFNKFEAELFKGNSSEIPSHLEILSFDEGIDPYKFLDLQ